VAAATGVERRTAAAAAATRSGDLIIAALDGGNYSAMLYCYARAKKLERSRYVLALSPGSLSIVQ